MRAVLADHVLFRECLSAFREWAEKRNRPRTSGLPLLTDYLLLDFRITEPWIFDDFKVEPTLEVGLSGAYAAFVAPVLLPSTLDEMDAHGWTIALSAAMSFGTGRPVGSTRDPYWIGQPLTNSCLQELAVQFPVLTAGPGCHDCNVPRDVGSQYHAQTSDAVRLLKRLPLGKYTTLMQAMRLVQLAHLGVRDDFALGYYLLVSAIETAAQDAVKAREVMVHDPREEEWSRVSDSNPVVREIRDAWLKERSGNRHLSQRFVEFIMRYCPPTAWAGLRHPLYDVFSHVAEITNRPMQTWPTKKRWDEIYPEDLSENDIRAILAQAYNHRSRFAHEGESPPHRHPLSYDRYFEQVMRFPAESGEVELLVLPTFRLMAYVAYNSIMAYGTSLTARSE